MVKRILFKRPSMVKLPEMVPSRVLLWFRACLSMICQGLDSCEVKKIKSRDNPGLGFGCFAHTAKLHG